MAAQDWSDDQDDWADEDEPADTVRCSNCGADIYEEAEQCPACGEYVVHTSGPPWQGKPGWYVALAILGVIAVLLVFSGLAAWL